MTLQPPSEDATRPAPPGGSGGVPGEHGAPGAHLDELAAMCLADGQPVAPPLARHARGCGLCTALVDAFRSEGVALSGALALDEAELAFLRRASLPPHVAARAPAWGVTRDTPATLLAMLVVALVGAFAWTLVQPLVGAAVDLAQRSGALAVATGLVTDWLLGLLFTVLQVFSAAETVRLLQNPALPLALLSALALLAIWLGPLVPRPAGRPTLA